MKFPIFAYGLCLISLSTISPIAGYRNVQNMRLRLYSNSMNNDDMYDEYDGNDTPQMIQDYFPTSGIETFISTIASRRMLLPSEYELSFVKYPILQDQFLKNKWPERKLDASEDVTK